MRMLGEAFLQQYLAAEGETVLSCVGGYRYEGPGAQLFEQVEGDYFTILGLPLLPVLAALRAQGILVS
jgi:septum formation protein